MLRRMEPVKHAPKPILMIPLRKWLDAPTTLQFLPSAIRLQIRHADHEDCIEAHDNRQQISSHKHNCKRHHSFEAHPAMARNRTIDKRLKVSKCSSKADRQI